MRHILATYKDRAIIFEGKLIAFKRNEVEDGLIILITEVRVQGKIIDNHVWIKIPRNKLPQRDRLCQNTYRKFLGNVYKYYNRHNVSNYGINNVSVL